MHILEDPGDLFGTRDAANSFPRDPLDAREMETDEDRLWGRTVHTSALEMYCQCKESKCAPSGKKRGAVRAENESSKDNIVQSRGKHNMVSD